MPSSPIRTRHDALRQRKAIDRSRPRVHGGPDAGLLLQGDEL